MKEEAKIKELDTKKVYELVKKVYLFLKNQKNFDATEKFAAAILYAKTISDYNGETPEDFFLNVTLLTADESVFRDVQKQFENMEMYQ
jgi:hypothetical protein